MTKARFARRLVLSTHCSALSTQPYFLAAGSPRVYPRYSALIAQHSVLLSCCRRDLNFHAPAVAQQLHFILLTRFHLAQRVGVIVNIVHVAAG